MNSRTLIILATAFTVGAMGVTLFLSSFGLVSTNLAVLTGILSSLATWFKVY